GEVREWDPPSADRGPYGDLRNRERGGAIQQAVENLPWEYRELIVLRHFGELSYDEIATLKEMPLGTVKNKLFRARQMLKEELVDFLED
ncbi:MAG: sigma-70 family RNA polymerase sigma factor, partial [Acidobacteriota bacterium]